MPENNNQEFNAMSIIEETNMVTAAATLRSISNFQAVVQKTLVSGSDYGIIPGTKKPTLFKPGAEKINMLFRVNPKYEFMDRVADYDKGLFVYEIRCTLYKSMVMDGVLVEMPVAQGVGSCNSREKKYRWVSVYENEVPADVDINTLKKETKKGKGGSTYTKYMMENPDPCSIANTILKMAKKRAYVDATLQLAALSEIFTQDIEDMPQVISHDDDDGYDAAAAKAGPEGIVGARTAAPATATPLADPGAYILTFGNKHKNKTLREIMQDDATYLGWVVDSSNAYAETKTAIKRFLTADKAHTAAPVATAAKTAAASAKDITPPDDEGMVPPPEVPWGEDTQIPFDI